MRSYNTRLLRLETAAQTVAAEDQARRAEAAVGRVTAMVRDRLDALGPTDPAGLVFARRILAKVRAGIAELEGQGAV